ncbi:MAG: xanthine dehydrogenase family protein molybdopterin-binding subunit [Hyphomicrobiaceae bacterium]|nr:xanthine dehydrogenase family protein molybdopterin-binding subunit [Hyphomicrobiaceae bacterium]
MQDVMQDKTRDKGFMGTPVRRLEDRRFMTGAGTFIDDVSLPGQAYAAILRSPHAHARIEAIDVSRARAAPAVLLVVTGPEWVAAGHGPIPTKSTVRTKRNGSPFNEPKRHCLAVDTVHHVGEAVVLVVAETKTGAEAALELIDVDYADLPAVSHQVPALGRNAPQLWPEAPGNLCLDFELGNRAAVEAAFAKADHVVTLDIANNRLAGAPMEPRGVVADYDKASDSATLWNASQNIHANREIIAQQILNIASAKVRHVAPDVGGGFGAKNCVYPEQALVLYAARQLGRPVKWIGTRSEAFLADAHGRDQVSAVSLALAKDGTFLALKVESVGNLGAWCGTIGPFTPTMGTARTQGGPYAFPALLYTARAAYTNTCQTDPYRGAGRPEATFHVERIIEHAARTLGFDRIELRRKNLIPRGALPWTTPMGLSIDSGNFAGLLERTLELADFAGFPQRAAEARARGMRRGIAVSPYLECTGGAPKEEAKVTFAANGRVTVAVGSHSTGMGHETAFTQILADKLGLPLDAIAYQQADTALTKTGGGHGGSRGMEVGGNAVLKAADDVLAKGRTIAAHLLNSRFEDIVYSHGRFSDLKTGQSLAFAEVAAAAADASRLPAGMAAGALNATVLFEREAITVPNGCHAAEVEVDPETGVVKVVGFWAVDDFGTIINPMLADGQVMGGVAQGLGQALLEEVVYDPGSAQPLTGSLMDYALPRADNVPTIVVAYDESAPTTRNPLGVKGAGEAGCCGAPPAIVNAVLDALAEYGVTHLDMPLTPQKVWRAISVATTVGQAGGF